MIITKEMTKEKGNSRVLFNWFVKNFPSGKADSEAILKKLEEQKSPDGLMCFMFRRFKLSGFGKEWYANGTKFIKFKFKDGWLETI